MSRAQKVDSPNFRTSAFKFRSTASHHLPALIVRHGNDADVTVRKLLKVVRNPCLLAALLNAQLRMRGRTHVALSVRLRGRICISGSGRLVLGNGVTLIGSVVPIELISHKGARITIGDHTFINYGSSISAHELVAIERHCLLGHYRSVGVDCDIAQCLAMRPDLVLEDIPSR